MNECHLVEGKTDDPIISKRTTFCSEKVLTELNRDDQKMKEEYILDTFDLPTAHCTFEFTAICDKLGSLHI